MQLRQAVKLSETVKLVGICDRDPARASAEAAEFGVRPYTDYQELLADSALDLAMVLTPASTHREIVEAALDRGVHVFCEKPLATTMDDARAIERTCSGADASFFYGASYRYLPAISRARALIQDGAIGDILLMTEQAVGGHGLAHFQELPAAHYPAGGPGGPPMSVIDHGIHLADIFNWFAASPVTDVTGRGLVAGGGAGVEYLVARYANGAIGHLLYNAATYSTALPQEGIFHAGDGWNMHGEWIGAGSWDQSSCRLDVYGTHGSLRIHPYANALFLIDEEGLQKISLQGSASPGHFAAQIEACACAILREEPPPVGIEAALAALEMVLSVYRPPLAIVEPAHELAIF